MKQLRIYAMALVGCLLLTACPSDTTETETEPIPTPAQPKVYYQTETFSAQGGEQVVTLRNLSVAISNVTGAPEWLKTTPQFYSNGAPKLLLVAEENTGSEREQTLTVTAASGDRVMLTVKQQAGSSGGGEDSSGIEDPHNSETDQPAYAPNR